MKVPKVPINLNQLSPDERDIIEQITIKGNLRMTFPPVPKGDVKKGIARYVWRNVAFYISPHDRHHCMPVMSFCDLPGEYASPEFQEAEKFANNLVDKIVESIPPERRYGLLKWRRVI